MTAATSQSSSLSSKQDPVRLVQVTDTHLYGVPKGTLLKMNTDESLDYVLKLIQEKEHEMDMVLVTGDITQDGSDQAYEAFQEKIKVLDAPYRWIPGNHDNPKVMERLSQGTEACRRIEVLNNWQITLLDSSVDQQVHGHLAQDQLQLLEASLSTAAADEKIDHCLVTLHHNPIPGEAGWMIDIGLNNAAEFWEIATQFPKVRAVMYGHIHQELDFIHQGIRCFCTPSTCIQFKPVTDDFALDDINPGYRCLQLFADGHIESKVERVTGHKFEVDFNSVGY